MATKKQKGKKPASPSQSRSSFRLVVIGTMFNMAAMAATFGGGLCCSADRRETLHLNGGHRCSCSPLVVSAMAVLCFIAIAAEESCE
jgi:hypothetical protein